MSIPIKNCRGQSYDNATNMSGKYNGVQKIIKDICVYAEFIPYAAHSLNLVGKCSVESCSAAVSLFGIVQNVYKFFSCCTYRWKLHCEALSKNKSKKLLVTKGLSETRWSARFDAVYALNEG